MKRILALMLALVMCLGLCACGNRNVASPGSADEEATGETANNTDNNANTDAETNDTEAEGNSDTNENNDTESSGNDITPEVSTTAPASTETYNYTSSGANIEISYGSEMVVTETENGLASVEYGNSRLYVEDVTDEFDPNTIDAATYLYDYAYEKCVEMVMETYGVIEQFQGEYPLEVSGNEIYGYGAHMICSPQIQVYAFIKLVTLDDGEGYAVMIGVCDDSTTGVFDNVEVE